MSLIKLRFRVHKYVQICLIKGEIMTEQEALLVLNAVPELDAVRIRKLMAFFGSALKVLQASVDELSQAVYFAGDC